MDDCLAFGPSGVFHASWPVTKGPGRKFFCASAIKCVSGCEIKSTRNHSDTLSLRMGVWRDMIAVRKLKTHHECAFFRWVAFEYSHFCARRQSSGSGLPIDRRRRVKVHVYGLALLGK